MSWGVFWSLASLVVSTLGTLLVTPFLIRSLGVADYGLYLLVLSVSCYGGYFDLGLGWAAGRYFAQDYAAGRPDLLTQRLSSVAAAFLVLGTAATGLAVLVGPWLLHAAGSGRPDARLCFFFGSVAFLVSMEAGVVTALLRGAQRFGTAGAPAVLASVLLFAGSYVAVRGGLGIVALLAWGLVVNIVSFVLLASQSVQLLEPRTEYWVPGRARLLEMGRFGGWMTLSRFAMLGGLQLDRLAVSFLGSVAGLPFYAIPANLASRINVVGGSVASIFLPRVSLLQAQNRWSELKQQHASWKRLLTLSTLTIAVPIACLGPRFLGLWIGSEMASRGGPILIGLSVGWAIVSVGSLDAVTLEGLGRPDLTAKTLSSWGLGAVAIVLLLGRSLGVVAVAVGVAAWLAGAGITNIVLCTLLLRSHTGDTAPTTRFAGIVGTILFGTVFGRLLSGSATTLAGCILAMVGTAVVTGGLGTWAILGRHERALVIERTRAVLPVAWGSVRK